MRQTTVKITNHVKQVKARRLINLEYQRGFVEGQHEAALVFAVCIDTLLKRHDHVATAGNFAEAK